MASNNAHEKASKIVAASENAGAIALATAQQLAQKHPKTALAVCAGIGYLAELLDGDDSVIGGVEGTLVALGVRSHLTNSNPGLATRAFRKAVYSLETIDLGLHAAGKAIEAVHVPFLSWATAGVIDNTFTQYAVFAVVATVGVTVAAARGCWRALFNNSAAPAQLPAAPEIFLQSEQSPSSLPSHRGVPLLRRNNALRELPRPPDPPP